MRFIEHIQQDLKLFLYLNILVMIFRWIFVAIFSSQLNEAAGADFLATFWYGLRISLKTCGAFTAITLLLATIPGSFVVRWPSVRIRQIWGCIATLFLTFLFIARIPYYSVFNQSYNIMLFNGLRDDKTAIWETLIQQYGLLPRLLAVLVIGAVLCWIWLRILRLPVWQPKKYVKAMVAVIIIVLPVFAVFCRFGGAFDLDNGVHWESAARTHSHLLNEAILDDGQALYRAYKTNQRYNQAARKNISPEELRSAIRTLRGNPAAKTVDEAFSRKAPGSPLAAQPRQVVVIIGENYALWPLLPQYKDMGLCRTGEKLAREGAYTYHFLANGNGTMTSLNGFFTGLPDAYLMPNYKPAKAGEEYATGIGMVMKAMGYKTVFWYGGLSDWQNIGNFSREQGFDEFYSATDMPEQGQNSWGVPDEALFEAIEKYMANDTGKTFHCIMTTSNHPPFDYDVDSKGFPRSEVVKKLPATIPTDKQTIDQLGHIWYADDVMGKFIDNVEQRDPHALFVVTGDHAERFNFSTEVSLTELNGIPCFFYGDGVTQAMLPPTMVGSHIQIMPTLATLLLPQGATYYSLLPPLQDSHEAFNYKLVLENNEIYPQKDGPDKSYEKIIDAARLIAIWRVQKGNEME